jgi:uncharacterized membrane protein
MRAGRPHRRVPLAAAGSGLLVGGMAFRASGVAVGASPMRQLAPVHALAAFLFNAAILAVAVNLAAGPVD